MWARTQAELAHVLGVPVHPTLERWVRDTRAEPGLARGPKGYDLRAWVRWYVERRGGEVREQGRGARGEGRGEEKPEESAAEADRRKKVAQADLAELEFAEKSGQLIPVAEAKRLRVGILQWVAQVMERAGAELAPRLAGKTPNELRNTVMDYFNAVRREAAARAAKQ